MWVNKGMKIILFLLISSISTSLLSQTYICDKGIFEQLGIKLNKDIECAKQHKDRIIFTHLKKEIKNSFIQYNKTRTKSQDRYKNNSSDFLQQTILKTSLGKYHQIYFDKTGLAIKAKFFDNGADYFKDGLARYEYKERTGFIDKKGYIKIKAQYHFVSPFQNGYAKACMKCTQKQDGEHTLIESDEWFYINKTNRRFKSPLKSIKLPFDLLFQNKIFKNAKFDNTPTTRKKLKVMCKTNKVACLNYASFLVDENLGFDLGGYNYSIREFSHSTMISPSKGQLTEKALVKELLKLSKKNPVIGILVGIINYSYGEVKIGLEKLKHLCESNYGQACHFQGLFLDHQGRTKAAIKAFQRGCQLKINESCDNNLLLKAL